MMANDEKKRIAEELTPLGEGTGIERGLPDETIAGGGGERFDAERMEIQTRGLTIEALLKRIAAKTIDLGLDFEDRDAVWTDARRSRLIESLLLKIPLPAVYAAEDSSETWAVVDGGQRLISIARFVAPEAIGAPPLSLSGLEYLGNDFDAATFDRLPARLQRRLKETELEVHVIRHGTPEPVMFNIAARVNGDGMPLSRQELRHALIPGPARAILADWSRLPEFEQATAGSLRQGRMADRELVLRFVAFRLTPPADYDATDFDRFLGDSMRTLNAVPEEPEPVPVPEVASASEPGSDSGSDALPELPVDDLPGETDVEVPPEIDFAAASDEVADPLPAPAPAPEPAPDAIPESEPEASTQSEIEPGPEAESGPEPGPEPVTLRRLEGEFRDALTTAHAIFGEDAFRKRYRADDARNPINKALFEVVTVALAQRDPGERQNLIARREAVSKLFMELMHNRSFDEAVSLATGDPARIRTRFAEFAKILTKALE